MENYLPPQDQALDDFRKLFPMPSQKVLVNELGTVMKFRVLSDRLAAEWLLMASRIIRENRLPLQAEIDEWTAGPVIFDRWLVIEFIPSLIENICY